MFDATFYIPNYDWQDEEPAPPCPEDVIPADEKERLFEESQFCQAGFGVQVPDWLLIG